MSLNFGAASSHVDFSIGNAAQLGNGAFTLLALWKMPATINTGLVGGVAAGNDQQSFGMDTAHIFGTGDFSSGFGTAVAGDWFWVGLSKPAGSAHYRGHIRDYSTAGAWSHGEAVGAANHTDPGTSTSIQVGSNPTFSASAGDVAVAGIFTSVLSDGAIELACTSTLCDFLAANPQWAARFMQAAPSSIQDLTGGGGNETSRTGTITTTADPPNFDFCLGADGTPRPRLPRQFILQVMGIPRQLEVPGGGVVNIDGNLVITATETGTAAVDRNAQGDLVVTVNRTGTAAVDRMAQGDLVVTVNRTGTAAVDRAAQGNLVITATETGTAAVDRNAQGNLVITATETGTAAVDRNASGNLVVTSTETGTAAVDRMAQGDRPITVNATGTADIGVTGDRPITCTITGTASVDRAASGSLPITVGITGTADIPAPPGTTPGSFLPFF